jgi:hypothetical protein
MMLLRPTWPHLRRAALAALLLAFAGCRDRDPVSTADLPRCTGPVTVTTSTDSLPVLRWTPACRTTYVEVREAIDIFDVAWAVYSPDGMLGPGLRYGAAPAGAQTLRAARTLGADTSYRVNVGTRTADQFSESTDSFGGVAITACGTRVGGNCRTSPELYSGVTAEGVRLEASVTPTTVARGDTATVTFRFVNPTAQPITVDLLDECWTTRFAFTTPTGPSGYLVTCELPHVPLTIAANGAVERKVDFNGYQQLSSSAWACRRPGTYAASLFVNAAVGGRRVRSPEVRWTLVENDAARGICMTDI